MPNWCSNTIVIRGDVDKIKTILEKMGQTTEHVGIFTSLIGVDPDIAPTGWHESNLRRFGTKWDIWANESNIESTEDEIIITAETAWSPPVPFCITLAEKYGVNVRVSYSEPGCDFAGVTKIIGDEVTQEDYSYLEGLFHIDNAGFWSDIDDYDFPTDYEGTPEQWVKENFRYLNDRDRDTVVEKYKLYILDQETDDESGD